MSQQLFVCLYVSCFRDDEIQPNRNTNIKWFLTRAVSMNKHKIEIPDLKEKTNFVHEYSIRLDDIPMNCKSVGVLPHKA